MQEITPLPIQRIARKVFPRVKKLLGKEIEYNNLIQKTTINTILLKRFVIDWDSGVMQIVFDIGNTDVGGSYKQFKAKNIAINDPALFQEITSVDFNIFQNAVLTYLEGIINGTATTN